MNIEMDAPLKARSEIIIHAPIDKVWSLLTGINQWANWQPDVSSAKTEGDLSVGTIFKWKAKGMNIASTIQELEPTQKIGWTGISLGMTAIHIWEFEPKGRSTRVVTNESLRGWFPKILKFFDPTFLDKSLAGSLTVLKTEAER